jgi:hypothetical protein
MTPIMQQQIEKLEDPQRVLVECELRRRGLVVPEDAVSNLEFLLRLEVLSEIGGFRD